MLSLILLAISAWALLVAGAATHEYVLARDRGDALSAREASVHAVLSAGLGLSLMAAGWWQA